MSPMRSSRCACCSDCPLRYNEAAFGLSHPRHWIGVGVFALSTLFNLIFVSVIDGSPSFSTVLTSSPKPRIFVPCGGRQTSELFMDFPVWAQADGVSRFHTSRSSIDLQHRLFTPSCCIDNILAWTLCAGRFVRLPGRNSLNCGVCLHGMKHRTQAGLGMCCVLDSGSPACNSAFCQFHG